MKHLSLCFVASLFFCSPAIHAQCPASTGGTTAVAVGLNFNSTHALAAEVNGIGMGDWITSCPDGADPDCRTRFMELEPRVVRFPAAGDANYYNLQGDIAGHNIDTVAVEDFLRARFGCANPRQGELDPIDCPSCSTFSIAGCTLPDCTPCQCGGVSGGEESEFQKEFKKVKKIYDGDDGSTLMILDEFIQSLKEIYDEKGYHVKVIYVANIFTATPADLTSTLTYLTSTDDGNGGNPFDYAVDVVGVELGNEPWGKEYEDAGIFDGNNRFLDYYEYVIGDYTPFLVNDCLIFSDKGDFITEIRTEFPGIKIGLPTAPMVNGDEIFSICNKGNNAACSTFSHTSDPYYLWNEDLGNAATEPGLFDFDFFAAHFYFDERFYASDGCCTTCNNALWTYYADADVASDICDFLQKYTYDHNEDPILECDEYEVATACAETTAYAYNSPDSRLSSIFNGGRAAVNDFFANYFHLILDEYDNQLQLGDGDNTKEIWFTEWNILRNKNIPYTSIFENTFIQAFFSYNWMMSLYEVNWANYFEADRVKYATYWNGVGALEGSLMSKTQTDSGDEFGDQNQGTVTDEFDDGKIRRMNYYTFHVLKNIETLDLKSITSVGPVNAGSPGISYPNLKIDAFKPNSSSDDLYLFFCNAGDVDYELNKSNIATSPGGAPDVDAYETFEYFYVRQLYSTAGANHYFRAHDLYNDDDGSDTDESDDEWIDTVEHDVFISEDGITANRRYCEGSVGASSFIFPKYSLGFVKLDLDANAKADQDGAGLEKGFSITTHPNPFTSVIEFQIEGSVPDKEIIRIKILDVSGREIDQFAMTSEGRFEYSADLVAGLYLYHAFQDDKLIDMGKIVKQ